MRLRQGFSRLALITWTTVGRSTDVIKQWCTAYTYVSSPSSTRLAPCATKQRLGSYMVLVGCVGADRRESNKPGIAVTSGPSSAVHRAMLFPKASIATSMLLFSNACLTACLRIDISCLILPDPTSHYNEL